MRSRGNYESLEVLGPNETFAAISIDVCPEEASQSARDPGKTVFVEKADQPSPRLRRFDVHVAARTRENVERLHWNTLWSERTGQVMFGFKTLAFYPRRRTSD